MITNPRKFVYRIYYNQATSLNDGTMRLVNWFDGNNLGLNAEPILSHVKNIYENFNERSFVVPVAHVRKLNRSINQPVMRMIASGTLSLLQSPPWTFIKPINGTTTDSLIDPSQMLQNRTDGGPFDVSGRDDSLLKILARKMNFKFQYVNIQSMLQSDNATQPGELGLQMLQRRVREIY